MPNRSALISVSLLLFAVMTANAQDTLRDPTRPYNARAAVTSTAGGGSKVSSYRVTAIFTSDQRRVAVVNGQRVVEGDKVDGATVVEILTDSLRLNVRGKAMTSRVLPYGFRK